MFPHGGPVPPLARSLSRSRSRSRCRSRSQSHVETQRCGVVSELEPFYKKRDSLHIASSSTSFQTTLYLWGDRVKLVYLRNCARRESVFAAASAWTSPFGTLNLIDGSGWGRRCPPLVTDSDISPEQDHIRLLQGLSFQMASSHTIQAHSPGRRVGACRRGHDKNNNNKRCVGRKVRGSVFI